MTLSVPQEAVVIEQYRSRGLYPSVDAPVPSHIGGEVPAGQEFVMVGTDAIYYTTDGTDPRMTGGVLSPNAVEYVGPITISADMTIKARALTEAGDFSALLDLSFTVQ